MKLTELSDYVIPEQELPRIFWMSPLRKIVICAQAVPFLALMIPVAYYLPGRGALSAWEYAVSEPSGEVRVYILKLLPADFIFPALLALALAVIALAIAAFPLLMARMKINVNSTCDVERTSFTVGRKMLIYEKCQFSIDERCRLGFVDEEGTFRGGIRPYEYKDGKYLVATVAFMADKNKTLEWDESLSVPW